MTIPPAFSRSQGSPRDPSPIQTQKDISTEQRSQESEELRESLLDLERARRLEARARAESENLLEGLRALAFVSDASDVFDTLFRILRSVLLFEEAFVVRSTGGGWEVTATTSPRFEAIEWIPQKLSQRVLKGKPSAVFDIAQVAEWSEQPEAARSGVVSALHMSLQSHGEPAMLVCTHSERGFFNADHVQVATRFSALATEALNRIVAQAKLREAHHKLVQSARQAGMSEVANSVLHNVGNALNSVGVSVGVVTRRMKDKHWGSLGKLVELVDQHQDDFGAFVANDSRGRMLPKFLSSLLTFLDTDRQAVLEELRSLREQVDELEEIVATQQRYAGSVNVLEAARVDRLVEEAIALVFSPDDRETIHVELIASELPELMLDRHKLVQILVNLLNNARRAVRERQDITGRIWIKITPNERDGLVSISVSDNGVGIAKENLLRIFCY